MQVILIGVERPPGGAVMTTSMNNSSRQLPLLGHVLHGTVQMSALGAAGGALFGVLFGLIATLLSGLPWTIAGLAGYFAISGGAAGFVVGMLGTWIEGRLDPENGDFVRTATSPSPDSIERQLSVKPIDAGTSRIPQNRVAAVMNAKANRQPSIALRDPSRN
jgi:hypothetical protein